MEYRSDLDTARSDMARDLDAGNFRDWCGAIQLAVQDRTICFSIVQSCLRRLFQRVRDSRHGESSHSFVEWQLKTTETTGLGQNDAAHPFFRWLGRLRIPSSHVFSEELWGACIDLNDFLRKIPKRR